MKRNPAYEEIKARQHIERLRNLLRNA